MLEGLLEWTRAFWEYLEDRQPTELPAKPCDHQKQRELIYGRPEVTLSRPAAGPE